MNVVSARLLRKRGVSAAPADAYEHGRRYGYRDLHTIHASGYTGWSGAEWLRWLEGWRAGQADRRREGLPMMYEELLQFRKSASWSPPRQLTRSEEVRLAK